VSPVAELLERNARFAGRGHQPLPMLPRLGAVIVTCPDPRVDPAHVLGLRLGEAAVIRAAAGRVSPIVLQNLALLAQLAAVQGATGDVELVLMQHTDCGITRLTGPEHRPLLAGLLGVPPAELATMSIADPYGAVRTDIEALAANPLMPDRLSVAGLVYDVATGRAALVERRSPLRPFGTRHGQECNR
jgi:carbonic anhydrase